MPEHPDHIVVTDSAGVATSFLMRPGSTIRHDPASGQTQVTTVGESDRRGDTRTPEVIFTDQLQGMGTFEYEEINGVNSYTDSNCDTRNPGMVCLTPAHTALGSIGTGSSVYRLEYCGMTNADVIAFFPGSATAPYRLTGGSWTQTGSIGSITTATGFTRFLGYSVITAQTANGLWYSTDGSTWTNLAYAKTMLACCVHDNKLYLWNATNARLEWTTSPAVAPTTGISAFSLALRYQEQVRQLVEWQRGGRAMVFIITNKRVFWYDEDADTYALFYDFTELVSDFGYPYARVWRRTGNLHLVFGDDANPGVADTMLVFSGQTTITSPNERGGLPSASRTTLWALADGINWLFATGIKRQGTSDFGRVMAYNEQGGWHTLAVGESNAKRIAGMTYNAGTLYVAEADGTSYTMSLPDTKDLPLYATSRTYPTSGTYIHELAFTDGGTENMLKQATWVTVGARDMSLTYKGSGTPANTTIQVEYLRNSDTAWTSLGTLTHASTFPATMPIASGFGVTFRQIKFRLTLASTDANSTPIVTSFAVAYLRAETVRDAYTLELDLRDMGHPVYQGQDRAQLLAKLNAYRAPGALVALSFAGGDWTPGTEPAGYRRIAVASFSYGGIDYPNSGPGVYQCQFVDLTPPGSGDTP